MKQDRAPSAFSLIAGRLATAMQFAPASVALKRPTPRRIIYFADNMRYSPGADADKWRETVQSVCARYELEAAWPSEHFLFPNLELLCKVGGKYNPDAVREGLAKSPFVNIPTSIAVVAEISPFRGPHLNPVIAFEMGIAAALYLPIFAWTAATYPAYVGAKNSKRPRLLQDRVWCGEEADEDGHWYDEQGHLVENFGMVEHAMIAGNILSLSLSVEAAIASCARYLLRANEDQKGSGRTK
jgi:nucleoside 2-deoxyribosyltransferase